MNDRPLTPYPTQHAQTRGSDAHAPAPPPPDEEAIRTGGTSRTVQTSCEAPREEELDKYDLSTLACTD